MSPLELLAAALLVLGSIVVLRVLVEADRLDSPPAIRGKSESSEAESLRPAA